MAHNNNHIQKIEGSVALSSGRQTVHIQNLSHLIDDSSITNPPETANVG